MNMLAAHESEGRHSLQRSWLMRNRWLILRRTSQFAVWLLFLAGPWLGVWLATGNLSSSRILGWLPLTDPYIYLQSLLAVQSIATTAGLGAAIVLLFYLVVGGRTYCSWVCPINVVTDGAAWLRARLGLPPGQRFSRRTRYWVLAVTLVLAAFTGTQAWEYVNPVSAVQRGLVFGLGTAWLVLLALLLLDLFGSRQAWCGHLCPVGAFYGLLGRGALLRIRANRRADCNDCMDCFAACPEPQVIKPALKGAVPVITAGDCTNCGRCIDVCDRHVFEFGLRFNRSEHPPTQASETHQRGTSQ